MAGIGVGLILTSATWEEITYALQFDFATSNNEFEYEAQITRLQLGNKMRCNNIRELIDSMIVAKKINMLYVVKCSHLMKYAIKVKSLTNF